MMSRLSLIVFLCVSHLLYAPQLALAESVTLYGLIFPVDELQPVDANAVQFIVFGETFVTQKERVTAHVLRLYLKQEDFFTRYPQEEIRAFIDQAIQQQDASSAALMLARYLVFGGQPVEAHREYLFSLGRTEESQEVFDLVLRDPFAEKLPVFTRGFLLLRVGVNDNSWMPEARSFAIIHAIEMVDTATWIVAQPGTEEGQDRYNKKLVKFVQAAITSSSTSSAEAQQRISELSAAIGKLDALSKLAPQLDRAKLYPYLGRDADSVEYQMLRLLVVQKIHDFAEFALKNKAPASALILLGELQPGERSERTQTFIVAALQALKAPNEKLKKNRVVRLQLRSESSNSEAVRAAYTDYLRREFAALVTSGQLHAAGRTRELFRSIDVHAESEYEDMIFQEVEQWFKKGQPAEGEKLLRLRSGGISIVEGFQLYLLGRYGSPLFILLLVLIPILAVFFFYLRNREFADRVQRPQFVPEEPQEVEPEMGSRRGGGLSDQQGMAPSFAGLRGRESPELREYREHVGLLGLPPGAGLRDIKKAYRSKIKEVHPDAQQGGAGEASDDFIKLSGVYERIIELRRALGFPD